MSNMKNIPRKIYLQIGDECPDDADFNELSEVSWCKDKIYDNDIEFALQNKVSDISVQNFLEEELCDYEDESGKFYRGDTVIHLLQEYASIVNERKELCAYEILCVVDEILLEKSKEAGLHVDFSDNDYNGDKDAPMDRIGLIDYLFEKVNERKDNIPADFKQVTGHNSPKEMIAYEKGREDEQEVIMKWIEQWDGSSNSAMGMLLKKKFDERKDNVGVWVKASARLPEKLAYYNCKFRGIPIIFYIDSRNETISYDSQIIDKKYWKFTQWLDESQPKQKEVDEERLIF